MLAHRRVFLDVPQARTARIQASSAIMAGDVKSTATPETDVKVVDTRSALRSAWTNPVSFFFKVQFRMFVKNTRRHSLFYFLFKKLFEIT